MWEADDLAISGCRHRQLDKDASGALVGGSVATLGIALASGRSTLEAIS